MSKRVYISADYDKSGGDQEVVNELNKWGQDNYHKVDFVDMAKVASGTVANGQDCRICDLKEEFNQQINASSAVIFVVGNMTKYRTAGDSCERANRNEWSYYCTPYKGNSNGKKPCNRSATFTNAFTGDVDCINSYSYLKHEFMQAVKRNKDIIILYNSTRKESTWLPSYMSEYESKAEPFWINYSGAKVGNYTLIKKFLGFE